MTSTAIPHPAPDRLRNPFALGCAYIDAQFVPIAEARIPIADTGFTRSDCTYYAFAVPYVWLVAADEQLRGSHLVIARDVIRIDPAAVDPTVKNFHWGDLTRGSSKHMTAKPRPWSC